MRVTCRAKKGDRRVKNGYGEMISRAYEQTGACIHIHTHARAHVRACFLTREQHEQISHSPLPSYSARFYALTDLNRVNEQE